MPRVSKMLIVRSIYRTRQVPNENTKKGVSTISECGLCRTEFTDLFDRRAACHVLGVPGQGIAKCENRQDLDEDTRQDLMDCCLAVKAWAARGAGGPSPISNGGEVNPNCPPVFTPSPQARRSQANVTSNAPVKRKLKSTKLDDLLGTCEQETWNKRLAKTLIWQGNMAHQLPSKPIWSKFFNDLARAPAFNWVPPKRHKIGNDYLTFHYDECVKDVAKLIESSEFVSGSMDHFDLQNRTQVNGKTLITPRGITFSGASDCTDVAKMGTDYMEQEMQDHIVTCGGEAKCPSLCVDGTAANKAACRRSEAKAPTTAHILCQMHGIALFFGDVYKIPFVRDKIYKPALKVAKKFRGNKFLRDKLQATQRMPEFKSLPAFLRGPKSYVLPPKTRAAGKHSFMERYQTNISAASAVVVNPAYHDKFLSGTVAALAVDSGSDSDEFEDSDSNPYVDVSDDEDEDIGVVIDSKTAKQIMQNVKKITLDTDHHEFVAEILEVNALAYKAKLKFDRNHLQACTVYRRWNEVHQQLIAWEEEEGHEHWQSTFSDLWLKRWVERHHPSFAMAHVLNPTEAKLDPMSSQDIKDDVDLIMRAHFPIPAERADMYLILEEFHNQEGCFSVLDPEGNERHVWMPRYMKKTAPWRWWKTVATNNYPKFTKFATKILQIVVNSSSCERVFSMWGIVCTKLRNRLSLEKQRKSL